MLIYGVVCNDAFFISDVLSILIQSIKSEYRSNLSLHLLILNLLFTFQN